MAVLRLDRLHRPARDRTLLRAPVQFVLGVALQVNLGFAQRQRGQHEIAMDQWPELDIEFDLLGLEQVVSLAPVGIGYLDVIETDVRCPSPIDRDFGNLGLPAGYGVGMVLDFGTDIVRGHEYVGGNPRRSDDQDQHAYRPTDDLESPSHVPGASRRGALHLPETHDRQS